MPPEVRRGPQLEMLSKETQQRNFASLHRLVMHGSKDIIFDQRFPLILAFVNARATVTNFRQMTLLSSWSAEHTGFGYISEHTFLVYLHMSLMNIAENIQAHKLSLSPHMKLIHLILCA